MPVPKHSKDLKLKVIQAYLDGSKGYKILPQEFNVDLQTVWLWIEKYKTQGEEGLNIKLQKTYYSPEFKIKAVQMLLNVTGFNTKRIYTNMVKQDKTKITKPVKDNKDKSQQELIDEVTAL